MELEKISLTEIEAGDLAIKLRVLHNKISEIENAQAEEAQRNARNAASHRNR